MGAQLVKNANLLLPSGASFQSVDSKNLSGCKINFCQRKELV